MNTVNDINTKQDVLSLSGGVLCLKRLRILRLSVLAVILGWTFLVILALAWRICKEYEYTLNYARIQADLSFSKDLVYRRWAAEHGGVYVLVTEDTPPNPYLAHIANRDIKTSSGINLTLLNPAYMTRQVHELGAVQYGHKGHITSLKPLRPENVADSWETEALKMFENGSAEVSEVVMIAEREYLRLMRPMFVEQSCLKCHGEQGYKIDEVRGGISVAVPMDSLRKVMYARIINLFIWHGLVWFFGLCIVLLGAFRLCRSIQARDIALKEVRDSEERYRVLFESSQDAIMTLEPPSWLFTSGNPSCVDMFRARDCADFVSYPPWKLSPEFQPDGRPSVDKAREMIDIAMIEGSHFFEWTHRRMDGEEFIATVILARMKLGDHVFLQAAVRDITTQKRVASENKELDRKLRQQQKLTAVGTLASGAAHEINNPVNGIMNYAQLIGDQSDAGSSAADFSHEILVESERIASIVRGLMSFSEDSGGERIFVSINKLLESLLSQMQISLEEDHISINLEVPEGIPLVICQPEQIGQLIKTFLANARDALNERYSGEDEDKIIMIGVSQIEKDEASWLRITVEDRGNGMSPEIRDRIFEAFFTTKGRAVGSGSVGRGLGLCTALNIAHNHDGSIEVECEQGHYTRFHLDLPILED